MANKQALRDLQARLAARLQAAKNEPVGRTRDVCVHFRAHLAVELPAKQQRSQPEPEAIQHGILR